MRMGGRRDGRETEEGKQGLRSGFVSFGRRRNLEFFFLVTWRFVIKFWRLGALRLCCWVSCAGHTKTTGQDQHLVVVVGDDGGDKDGFALGVNSGMQRFESSDHSSVTPLC